MFIWEWGGSQKICFCSFLLHDYHAICYSHSSFQNFHCGCLIEYSRYDSLNLSIIQKLASQGSKFHCLRVNSTWFTPWCSHYFGTTLCSLLGSVSTQDGTQGIQANFAQAEEKIKALEGLNSSLHETFQRTVRYAQWSHSALRKVQSNFHFEDDIRRSSTPRIWESTIWCSRFTGAFPGITENSETLTDIS